VDLRWLEKVAKKGGKEGDGGGGRGGGGSNAAAVEARRLYVEIFLARQGGAAQGVRARAAQTGEGVQQESEEEEGEGALVVSVQEKRRQEMVATNMLKLLADSGDAQSKFHYGSFMLSDTARLHKDEDAAQGLDMAPLKSSRFHSSIRSPPTPMFVSPSSCTQIGGKDFKPPRPGFLCAPTRPQAREGSCQGCRRS